MLMSLPTITWADLGSSCVAEIDGDRHHLNCMSAGLCCDTMYQPLTAPSHVSAQWTLENLIVSELNFSVDLQIK